MSTILQATTRRVKFEIPIQSKYTIIRGYSATGKSTLILTLLQRDSKIQCDLPIAPLPSDLNALNLDDSRPQTLFFGDEDLDYVHTLEFQKRAASSKHCFMLITRNPLAALSYSYKDILKIELQNKVHKGVPMYTVAQPLEVSRIQAVYTEDSRSELFLIQQVVPSAQSTNGKDNVSLQIRRSFNSMFVVDGIGFGSCMDRAVEELKSNHGNLMYLQESFEAMVYHSSLCNGEAIPPWDCRNREEYYTTLLQELLAANGISYSKDKPLPCLQKDCCYSWKKCSLFTRDNKLKLVLGELYEYLKNIQGNITAKEQDASKIGVTEEFGEFS